MDYPKSCLVEEPYNGPAELEIISGGQLDDSELGAMEAAIEFPEIILLPGRPPLPLFRMTPVVSSPEVQVRGFMLDMKFYLVSHGPLAPGMKRGKGVSDDDGDDGGGASDRNLDSYSIGVKTVLVVPLCWS